MEMSIGEDVRSVRYKLDLADAHYHTPVESSAASPGMLVRGLEYVNMTQTKAQEICEKRYGFRPLKEVSALGAIIVLRAYYSGSLKGDDQSCRKIVESIQVKGAAAWFIHTAVKRNYGKKKKGKIHAHGNLCTFFKQLIPS